MISVCLDTTLTTTKCNRYSFRVHDYAPAQAVAFAPELVKMGKKWHIAYADYSWGQSTKDAYADQIKKAGGEIVGTTGIPLGTADMTRVSVEDHRQLRRVVRHLLRQGRRDHRQPGVRSRSHQEVQMGGRWCDCARSTNLPALGNKIEGFIGINRYHPGDGGPFNTPQHSAFFDEAEARLAKVDPSGPLPDRYVQSNFEAMNALEGRHGEVGLQRAPRGHDEADRGA